MGNSIKSKYKYLDQTLKFTKKYICCIRKPAYKMLMVGLDGCGKTTLLYNLTHDFIPCSVPTVGFNI